MRVETILGRCGRWFRRGAPPVRGLLLAGLLLSTPACARASPPPYVCTAGLAEGEGRSVHVLICRPVPPASIEPSP